MFGSGKSTGRSAGVETLIGRQTELMGDIRFSGGLHVDGRIQGDVTGSGTVEQPAHLSVSLSGSIEGRVQVPSLVLNGSIVGDVYTSEKLTLGAKSRVTGDVHYKLLEMAGGAQVNGKLVHESAEAPPAQPTASSTEPAALETVAAAPSIEGAMSSAPEYQQNPVSYG